MNIRTRLRIGYGGFVLALALLGGWSAHTMSQMSAVSGLIISENYDSVIAAQSLKESLERQDSAAVFELLGEHDRAQRQAADHRARFDAALATAAANITEVGEGEIIATIGRERDEYYRLFDAFMAAPGARTQRYFDVLEPRFNSVRAECDRLLSLNQEAMKKKAGAASATARRWFLLTLGLAMLLMSGGVIVEVSLSRAILEPVRHLTGAMTKVAAGELDASVPVRATDEIGVLADGFNRMAERIRELRRSDLGRLLVAQRTTDAAIDALREPLIVTDSVGNIVRVNTPAERLFGSREEILGRPIAAVARHSPVPAAVAVALAAHGDTPIDPEAERSPWVPDGEARAFRVHCTSMRDADGGLAGVVTLLEDVTAANAIERVESEFFATAAHELRGPVTDVQLAVHVLLEGAVGELTGRQQEVLQGCRADAERLAALVRGFTALSATSLDVAARQDVRPSVLVRDAVGTRRLEIEGRGLHLHVDVPPDLPAVHVDRDAFVRALENLLVNSTRRLPSDGTVSVTGAVRGNQVVFTVTDTGPAIPGDLIGHIFEPFALVPGSVTDDRGLGLTLVRRVVDAHGGGVSAQSEGGAGASFVVTIPVRTAASAGALPSSGLS